MVGLREFQAQNKRDRWFSLNTDQEATIHFLRELKDALWVVEHISAESWQKRALCTADEGICYGCKRALAEPFSGWAQKPKLYIDAYVDDGYEKYEAIVSQTLTPNSLTPALIDYHAERGTIMDTSFHVVRTGKGKRSKYVLTPKHEEPAPLGTKILLQKHITKIEADRQEKYYTN